MLDVSPAEWAITIFATVALLAFDLVLLSVDNLFVFVIIMSSSAVPAAHQHRVLTFGIIAALILRAIFIAIGAALLSLFSFMFLLFGLLLIGTAIQLFATASRTRPSMTTQS
jgi:predicted tellurium resistance membrane protein TerC